MSYKFSPGQNVLIQRYDRWMGDYEASAVIIGPDNVFLNGAPTYIVRINEEVLHEIPETTIMAKETSNEPRE